MDLRSEIIENFQTQEKRVDKFRADIENKNIVIVLGNTRSGKSTVVNYLIGTELEAFESGKKEYKIRKQSPSSNGPTIGHESVSCTSLPTIYKIQGCDDYIVDQPGFEDNRGIIQDILNAFCISQIQYAKSVKFVIVFDIAELIHDNIRHFTKTLEYIQTLVTNFDKLRNSFCFIFTKDWKEYTQDEIIALLKNKILNVEGLNFDRRLVENISSNKNFVGLLRMPTREGKVSDYIDVNTKGAIRYTSQIDVEKCEITFTICDAAKQALLEIYPEYIESNYFDSEISRLLVEQSNYFDIDKYVYASYDEELEATLEILHRIRRFIQITLDQDITNLIHIKESLRELLQNIIVQDLTTDFKTSFKFVVLLDDSKLLEARYQTLIIENYSNALEGVITKVDNLENKINAEKSDRRTSKIIFNASAVGGVISGIPFLAGAAKVAQRMISSGSVLQKVISPGVGLYGAGEAAIGTTATFAASLIGGVAAGVAVGGLCATYKELYTKRLNARKEQGRVIN